MSRQLPTTSPLSARSPTISNRLLDYRIGLGCGGFGCSQSILSECRPPPEIFPSFCCIPYACCTTQWIYVDFLIPIVRNPDGTELHWVFISTTNLTHAHWSPLILLLLDQTEATTFPQSVSIRFLKSQDPTQPMATTGGQIVYKGQPAPDWWKARSVFSRRDDCAFSRRHPVLLAKCCRPAGWFYQLAIAGWRD